MSAPASPVMRRAQSVLATAFLCLAGASGTAAQTLLSPDALSFFEEPLAGEILGFTVTYNQLTEAPVIYDFNTDRARLHPRAAFRAGAERQLPNAVTLGAAYSAEYDDRDADKYEDRWEAYFSGVWGRLSGGEVNESVRDATRRMRGTGNADLELDKPLGRLDEDGLGGAYSLRFSAVTLHAGADQNGDIDAGVTYARPHGQIDLRVTGRFTRANTRSTNGATRFTTHSGGLVGQIEYGSLLVDAGFGVEHLDSTVAEGIRAYISGGVQYKVRNVTVSAEGHYGKTGGDTEASAALGLRYDLARGLSLNLGYNYVKANAAVDGVQVLDVDKSEAISSVRYEF